jgi:hypothetical protein
MTTEHVALAAALVLVIAIVALVFIGWCVVSAVRWYRAGPPSRMATSTRPAKDSRNWSKQYMDSIK